MNEAKSTVSQLRTPAKLAAVWQNFRLALIQRRVYATEDFQLPDSATVLEIMDFLDQIQHHQTETTDDFPAFDLGHERVCNGELPYPVMALIILGDGLPKIWIVSAAPTFSDGIERRVSMSEFQYMEEKHWARVNSSWFERNNIECALPYGIVHQEEVFEKRIRIVWRFVAVVIGLMALPAGLVERQATPRPISPGRSKPHPLAPATT